MEPLIRTRPETTKNFLRLGLLFLVLGMLFGLTGAAQYVNPVFLKPLFSFEKIRPLHVSSVLFWILFASTGAVFSYLQEHTGRSVRWRRMSSVQFLILGLSALTILISYCFGIFGGREYWEFSPVLAIPIAIGWTLFIVNYCVSVRTLRNQPVYVWMWTTGVFFFLLTFQESYLWLLPYFRSNVINDMTVQWKSYGSMVGSWNMLIYGCSIFLMDKISGQATYGHSSKAFGLYFLGLFNLMFNWGHHIYTLPTHGFIKNISYLVSMTELLILGNIIFQWKSTVNKALIHFNRPSYRFILAADVWIFLSLLLSIAMSVPAVNVYTHGTQVTVAHAMGTTIGINSFLLLAFAFDILQDSEKLSLQRKKWIYVGYWMANISLFVFWVSLITAGIVRARWQMSNPQLPFSSMMLEQRPLFVLFLFSGVGLALGILLCVHSLIFSPLVGHFKKKSAPDLQINP